MPKKLTQKDIVYFNKVYNEIKGYFEEMSSKGSNSGFEKMIGSQVVNGYIASTSTSLSDPDDVRITSQLNLLAYRAVFVNVAENEALTDLVERVYKNAIRKEDMYYSKEQIDQITFLVSDNSLENIEEIESIDEAGFTKFNENLSPIEIDSNPIFKKPEIKKKKEEQRFEVYDDESGEYLYLTEAELNSEEYTHLKNQIFEDSIERDKIDGMTVEEFLNDNSLDFVKVTGNNQMIFKVFGVDNNNLSFQSLHKDNKAFPGMSNDVNYQITKEDFSNQIKYIKAFEGNKRVSNLQEKVRLYNLNYAKQDKIDKFTDLYNIVVDNYNNTGNIHPYFLAIQNKLIEFQKQKTLAEVGSYFYARSVVEGRSLIQKILHPFRTYRERNIVKGLENNLTSKGFKKDTLDTMYKSIDGNNDFNFDKKVFNSESGFLKKDVQDVDSSQVEDEQIKFENNTFNKENISKSKFVNMDRKQKKIVNEIDNLDPIDVNKN